VFAANGGGPPKAPVPPAFAVPNAHGVAFVADSPNGPLGRIAVGVASASPQLAFFSEGGASLGTAPLAAAPLGVAYGAPYGSGTVPQTVAQLYVTSANGVAALDPFGAPVAAIPDAGAPFGIDVDPNVRTVVVAERSGGGVTTYLDDLSATDGPHSFATPAFTQPQGVCDVF
jgi:hypothetical protein